MRTLRLLAPRTIAALLITATLLAPAARAAVREGARPGRPPAADTAAAVMPPAGAVFTQFEFPPLLVSRVPANLTTAMLDHPGDHTLVLEFDVDSLGQVRDPRVVRGEGAFADAARDAVTWWRFAPARAEGHAVAARVRAPFVITIPADTDPVTPDVLQLAADAEARGDVRGAMDAWTGALARVGRHTTLREDYALRAHILRLAASLPRWPDAPPTSVARARSQFNLLQRNLARAVNADCAAALDAVLREAPWYADAYKWRASARAGSGDRDGAWRDVRCYALATRDSASGALATAALRALAADDTLGAHVMLKR